MKVIKMEEKTISNLLEFLNRVTYNGLQEVQCINAILKDIGNAEEFKNSVE